MSRRGLEREGGKPVSSDAKGLKRVDVRLKWDPSPWDRPPHHLDIIATTYAADAPHGRPVYVVQFDKRSPDGTINMSRHSRTGQGFGFVEEMTFELDRLSPSIARVIVGVAIHQDNGHKTFDDVSNTGVVVAEGYRELLTDGFERVAGATAATVAEFTRNASGAWEFREAVRGFDSDPVLFATEMGSAPRP
ncbi:TerD-family protein [Streptomyces sp. SID7813]|uniref:TerD domain-containing protein n=2 Tax=Streptomyces coelicolor (strain ATCC BAA-471 / A3(2) / M145) TaxID=100226 RepID=Q93RS6_STRCO|nr:TerD-family protein [Streptomyces sp. SID7813]NSL81246.1 TerD family protein [Streptomyces coelicolor]QFI46136.1 TerD family protein [Streptomyces coelicolor A3(2)]THA93273.1 TerD-family protein [Streptomyces sp. LRa12]QKN69678.1 TerD family protein [Streptomyces coelicolor]